MKRIAWRIKRMVTSLVVLGCLGWLVPILGLTCSCAPESDASIALEQADAVFAGRVVALELVTIRNVDPTVWCHLPPSTSRPQLPFTLAGKVNSQMKPPFTT